MSRREPTLVEQLIKERDELEKLSTELESFRRSIRLGDGIGMEQSPVTKLRRLFFRGRGQLGSGVPEEIPYAIVQQFYSFTHEKSAETGSRIREINTELEARSKES